MSASIRLSSVLIATVLIATIGCSKTADNRPPAIDSVLANPDTIQVLGTTELTVDASDPDNNPLHFEWQCSFGTFNGSGRSVTWQAPDFDGTFSILCVARDGEGGRDHALVDVSVLSRILTGYETINSFTELLVDAARWNAQEFRLPRNGNVDSLCVKIDHIEGAPGDMVLEIWEEDADMPFQTILTTPARPAAAGWHKVVVSPPHFVHGNTDVYIVARALPGAPGGYYVLAGDRNGVYAGGVNESSDNEGVNWTAELSTDSNFKIIGRWE
jgi:hypothetical protein